MGGKGNSGSEADFKGCMIWVYRGKGKALFAGRQRNGDGNQEVHSHRITSSFWRNVRCVRKKARQRDGSWNVFHVVSEFELCSWGFKEHIDLCMPCASTRIPNSFQEMIFAVIGKLT
jgi:hypothetical protein